MIIDQNDGHVGGIRMFHAETGEEYFLVNYLDTDAGVLYQALADFHHRTRMEGTFARREDDGTWRRLEPGPDGFVDSVDRVLYREIRGPIRIEWPDQRTKALAEWFDASRRGGSAEVEAAQQRLREAYATS